MRASEAPPPQVVDVSADVLIVRQPIDGVRRFTVADGLTTLGLVNGTPWSKPRRSRYHRNRPGLYFFASTCSHVSYESLEEHSALLALDHSQSVAAILAQPFKLEFLRDGERKAHVPDNLVVRHNGDQVVVDVRPLNRIDGDLALKVAFTREFSRAAGFEHVVFDGMRPTTRKSLEFLHAYSDGRRYAPGSSALGTLRAHFEQGATLRSGVAKLGGSQRYARMWIYHLMWTRQLSFDHDRPLSDARVLEWNEV